MKTYIVTIVYRENGKIRITEGLHIRGNSIFEVTNGYIEQYANRNRQTIRLEIIEKEDMCLDGNL